VHTITERPPMESGAPPLSRTLRDTRTDLSELLLARLEWLLWVGTDTSSLPAARRGGTSATGQ
jgi:hypothetical protein